LNLSKALLELTNIKKQYIHVGGIVHPVLEDISFNIPNSQNEGSVTSVIAPLSAGKSTLLKIISRIEREDEGSVFLCGEKYTEPCGKIVYIPERPSSYPWLNTADNVKFILDSLGLKETIDETVNHVITLCGLNGYEGHIPHNKSYGFRFRISLARALAIKPKLILLDDCFKIMDSETKLEIYSLLLHLSHKEKFKFLLATTNIQEALKLSGKIFLMSASPAKIFEQYEIEIESLKGSLLLKSKLVELRRDIENSFRKENVIQTITFSI
jgi:ABC-type nitrate/sulfonate/bicarbonate transport system ATPase subunit